MAGQYVSHKELLEHRDWIDGRLGEIADRIEKRIDDKVGGVIKQVDDHETRIRTCENSERKTNRLMLAVSTSITAIINVGHFLLSRILAH